MEQEHPPTDQGDITSDPAAIQAKVNGPAIALIVTAIIGMVFAVLNIILNVAGVGLTAAGDGAAGNQAAMMYVQGGMGIVSSIIGVIVGVIILMGAMKMKKLESRGFALTASILAMIPCVSPCCILGLPFGIWAIVVLSNEQVKAAFK